MSKNFYITTPIYYPSAKLHIGHAYTTIAGDVISRYKKQQGYDVFYLTGTDEHGQKIETVANQNNKTPQKYVDEIVEEIKKVWESLNIDYTKFIRTTDKYHEEEVQKIFSKLIENDDIYLGKYEGLYCKSDEAYYTETQAVDGICPDCGKKLELIEEESYFFKCSKYTDCLLAYYEDHPDFLEPNFRIKELVNNFIKTGLDDLAVSRTSFDWGIPVKEKNGHVIYVWIDALTNYITALGYGQKDSENFGKFWPADVQLVGKEIIRFHAIYWPMILMALELPLPKKIFAHGWLLMENDKMSKSKGNVIYPDFLIENYGADTLRYYLMREVPFGADGQFTPTSYINRINNDLVNDLSNLVNRTISMVNKYFDGEVQDNAFTNENYVNHEKKYLDMYEKFTYDMDNLLFSKALEELWIFVSQTNKLIDLEEPWVLARDIETNRDRLEKCLYTLLESINRIGYTLYPFMPESVIKILNNIGVIFNEQFVSQEKYQMSQNIEIVYQRLDSEEEIKKIRNKMQSDMEKSKEKLKEQEANGETGSDVPRGTISIDEFDKVNIEVGQIIEYVKHPKADKLYVLKVQMKDRVYQIVSGLVEYYNDTELLNKKILVVENLKPTKLRGELSEGMLLTTEKDGKVKIIEVDAEVGAIVK